MNATPGSGCPQCTMKSAWNGKICRTCGYELKEVIQAPTPLGGREAEVRAILRQAAHEKLRPYLEASQPGTNPEQTLSHLQSAYYGDFLNQARNGLATAAVELMKRLHQEAAQTGLRQHPDGLELEPSFRHEMEIRKRLRGDHAGFAAALVEFELRIQEALTPPESVAFQGPQYLVLEQVAGVLAEMTCGKLGGLAVQAGVLWVKHRRASAPAPLPDVRLRRAFEGLLDTYERAVNQLLERTVELLNNYARTLDSLRFGGSG